jgi:hypothetical protein
MIFSLILLINSVTVSLQGGAVMPDGKVDKVVEAPGEWHGPAWGADVSVDFAPNWKALQQWNEATVGVGLSYWNMGHEKLGHAIAPYIYMDVPLVKTRWFELGLRPGLGVAFMTKTYRNTVPDGHMFVDVVDANQSIGSVTNLYFPEKLYMHFPLVNGWSVGLSGGWYHISNGSIRQPNSGYNIFGGELGVKKVMEDDEAMRRKGEEAKGERREGIGDKKWSVAIAGTMGGRQVYYRDQQTFMVGSLHAAAYWHAHPVFRLGGGVDVFYDGAYVPRKTYFGKTNLSLAQPGDCWRVGVSLQPEFVVGDFTAGLHLGAYMYDPVKALEPQWKEDGLPQERLDKPIFYAYDLLNAGSAGHPDGWLYTEVVLRYHLPWHMFVQAMMKSHLTKVEFVSLGLGFWY